MCVCWICFVSERWNYVMLLSIKCLSRKHFFSFSEEKVCVSRHSQGRHLCSLLIEEQMKSTVLFWLILEQMFQKPGTSGAFLSVQFTADLPKQPSQMKTQFPSPQNTQKGPYVPLSRYNCPDTHLPPGQGLKVFSKLYKALLCHLTPLLILQAFLFVLYSQTWIYITRCVPATSRSCFLGQSINRQAVVPDVNIIPPEYLPCPSKLHSFLSPHHIAFALYFCLSVVIMPPLTLKVPPLS